MRVSWTARSNESILKEINPEYSLEGLMLKLKLQYFGHLMQSPPHTGKDPDAGKDGRQKKRGAEDEMVSTTDSVDTNLSKLQKTVKDREAWRAVGSMGSQRVRHN